MNKASPPLMTRGHGFTLIEAAIVLVVIGLILGVVLQGQSLIRNAEYRSFKSDIRDYQSAFYEFRDRYNALPGDFARADTRLGLPTTANGLGTGTIDEGPQCDQPGHESCLAWRHLRAARLITGNPDLAGNDSQPTHPFGGVFNSFFTGDEGNGIFENKMLITGVPVDIAIRLESEIDDEVANRGRVSCLGCNGEDYPDDEATVDLVFSL